MELWFMLGFALTHILFIVVFFIFLFFFKKLIRIRKNLKEVFPFIGLSFVFLLSSLSTLFTGWFDYFRWNDVSPVTIVELFKLEMIFLLSGTTSMAFLSEYVLRKTKYIITIIGISFTLFVALQNNFEAIDFYATVFGITLSPLTFLLIYLVLIRPTTDPIRLRMKIALLGVILVLPGIILRSDYFVFSLGVALYSIAPIITLIGMALIGYGFMIFSTFTDLNWKAKLRELLVIAKNGSCLYTYSFEQRSPLNDSDLIAGGFSGIQSLLSEIVKTNESLLTINYKNLKIMLDQEIFITSVLIIKEESDFIRYKLQAFSKEFNIFFKDVLQNWNGETHLFIPTKAIIERIFEINA